QEYKTAFASPASISQKEPPKKLLRQAQAQINKKYQEEEQSAILPEERNSAILIPDIVPLLRSNIIFNPNRHRIQQATRRQYTQDKIYYIEKE
ncbi:12092_t:CDS:2, partial [Racocetra persica]